MLAKINLSRCLKEKDEKMLKGPELWMLLITFRLCLGSSKVLQAGQPKKDAS